jgi:hypothetical protein
MSSEGEASDCGESPSSMPIVAAASEPLRTEAAEHRVSVRGRRRRDREGFGPNRVGLAAC